MGIESYKCLIPMKSGREKIFRSLSAGKEERDQTKRLIMRHLSQEHMEWCKKNCVDLYEFNVFYEKDFLNHYLIFKPMVCFASEEDYVHYCLRWL